MMRSSMCIRVPFLPYAEEFHFACLSGTSYRQTERNDDDDEEWNWTGLLGDDTMKSCRMNGRGSELETSGERE